MTSLPGSRTRVIRAAGASNETRFRSLGSASASSSNRARSALGSAIAASVASATEGACLATWQPLAGSKARERLAGKLEPPQHERVRRRGRERQTRRRRRAPVIFELTSSNAPSPRANRLQTRDAGEREPDHRCARVRGARTRATS